MKKLFIIFIVFYFKSTFSFAEENKCNEFKKLSKEYIGDKVKNKIKKKE